MSGFTFHLETSAHEVNELSADRQSQSSASEFSSRGFIGLSEGFEDMAKRLGIDSDARINDFESDAGFLTLGSLRFHHDLDFALGRKLDGVPQQVVENLAKSGGIPADPGGEPQLDPQAVADARA